MEQDEEQQRLSEYGLRCSSDVSGSAMTAATTQRPTSGPSLTTSGRKSPEIAVELTTLSGKSWSQAESGSDALSTLSSDTSASDDQKGDASSNCRSSNVASASSLHPVLSSRFSPSPRASLPVKKAWLIRYSDNDQKPASDASTSCFPNAGLDDNLLDREKFSFAHKLNNSFENSRLLSSENQASYISDSADDRMDEAKTPVSVVSISKPIPSRDTDSNYSETSVDSNISKNQKSKNPKRSLPSELPNRHTQMAKSASTQKNLVGKIWLLFSLLMHLPAPIYTLLNTTVIENAEVYMHLSTLPLFLISLPSGATTGAGRQPPPGAEVVGVPNLPLPTF